MASADVNGTPLPVFDGSTWDPWVNRLLFSEENGANGGIWQATLEAGSSYGGFGGSSSRSPGRAPMTAS